MIAESEADRELIDRELIEYLKSSLKNETYSIFYVLSCLKMLNEPDRELLNELSSKKSFMKKRIQSIVQNFKERAELMGEMGTLATYSFESPNVLRELYFLVSSLRLLESFEPGKSLLEFVSRFRKDCGFSSRSDANLRDTFYCVSVTKGKIGEKEKVIEFILSHECENGGFTKSAGGFPPYLEDTYYAIGSLKILGSRYTSRKTALFIASLQNPNGGFRRSIHGGISSLENSFYAISCLRWMGVLESWVHSMQSLQLITTQSLLD